MTETTREKLLVFKGETDLTFLELKTWRSFLHCIVGANQAYCNQLSEASDVLKMFAEYCDVYNTGTGKNSKNAAKKISTILDKTSQFHKKIFGDLEIQTDPNGVFAHLLGCKDQEFEYVKKKAMEQFERHQTLEKNSEMSWKSYLKIVKKLTDLELVLSESLSPEELKARDSVIELEQKLGTALDHYHACYNAEMNHRELLAQETELLKKRFLQDEEDKLCILFASINQTLIKLKKLTPQGLAVEKSISFASERPKIRDMAITSWKGYLKEHIFPQKKGNQESFNMDDLDDDPDSYDDGPKILSFHRRCRIGSLKMPNTDSPTDDIVNGIIDDILASLDAKLTSGHPESAGDSCQMTQPCESQMKFKQLELKGSEDSQKCTGTTYETEESVSAPELKSHRERISPVLGVSHRSNVTVYAWTSCKRHSPEQISIRTGMTLKQLQAANDKGMAYGYKRTRFGMKKYGFYPAELVSLSFADTIRESRSSA